MPGDKHSYIILDPLGKLYTADPDQISKLGFYYFFRTSLGSQQIWEEGINFPHIFCHDTWIISPLTKFTSGWHIHYY